MPFFPPPNVVIKFILDAIQLVLLQEIILSNWKLLVLIMPHSCGAAQTMHMAYTKEWKHEWIHSLAIKLTLNLHISVTDNERNVLCQEELPNTTIF